MHLLVLQQSEEHLQPTDVFISMRFAKVGVTSITQDASDGNECFEMQNIFMHNNSYTLTCCVGLAKYNHLLFI